MTTLEFKDENGVSVLVGTDYKVTILKDFKKGAYFAADGLSGNRIIGIANGGFNFNGLPTICWVDGDKLVFAQGMKFTDKGRVSVTDANAEELTHLLTMLKANGYELKDGEVVKVKWRAEKGCKYLFVQWDGNVNQSFDNRDDSANERHLSGNYFNPKTENEIAEEIANKQKQLYKR